MPAGGRHRALLPALRGHSLGFTAARQAVLGLPTGTGNRCSQGAGQAGATMARGRALVVAAAQPSATWQVTGGALAITAAATALMATTGLCVAALLLTPGKADTVHCCINNTSCSPHQAYRPAMVKDKEQSLHAAGNDKLHTCWLAPCVSGMAFDAKKGHVSKHDSRPVLHACNAKMSM